MKLQELIKTKMASGLSYAQALDAAVSQLQQEAMEHGSELTPEQLAEIGTARGGLAPTSDPVSGSYDRVAGLVAETAIGPELKGQLEALIKTKMAAGLDRVTATRAALAQIENDIAIPTSGVRATPEELTQLQALRGRIETGGSPKGTPSAPRDAVTTLQL